MDINNNFERQDMRNILKSNDPVSVTYTDAAFRNLVEEYITQQKSGFTLKGVCSYVLYWAVEDDKVAQGNSRRIMVCLSNFPSKRGQKELAHFAEREEPKVMSTAEEKTMQRIKST